MKKIKTIRKEIPSNNFTQTSYSASSGTLKPEVSNLIDSYEAGLLNLRKKESTIHVDEIASGIAKFYEKVRKIIDWKDDNMLRRGSIERILKRILFPKMVGVSFKKQSSEELAKTLTIELIRGGHLPNNEVHESKIDEVANALNKYLFYLDYVFNGSSVVDIKKSNNLATFIIEIAACEIEEVLTRPIKEQGIMNLMAQILDEKIVLKPETYLNHEEKLSLIKISVQRKLYHLDDNYVIYDLLKRKFPSWNNPNEEEMKWFAEKISSIQQDSEEYVNTNINRRFDSITEQVDAVFMLFDDVLENLKNNPETIKEQIENSSQFMALLTNAYSKRRKTMKGRLRNSAVFSTLSVFLSNWATFYLFEVPLAHFFYEEFNLFATLVDFILPTLVMFLLIVFIKPPSEKNLEKVLEMSQNLFYEHEEDEKYEINMEEKRFSTFKVVMDLVYILTALSLMCGIGYVFYLAKLPITSVVYDTLTIAMTIYAAVVVRRDSRELYVGDSRSFKDFLFDILTVPVAKIGSFLSRKWKEYNVIAIFTNYLVEIPLVATLDFVEAWSQFIKERKSELR